MEWHYLPSLKTTTRKRSRNLPSHEKATMRRPVARAAAEDSNMVFLTGDLGFMALEPLQTVMGERFINAGVAEQNMISVAAALARQAWMHGPTASPLFCYARPFEQIRNDICFHNLPVRLIGNGGGYGYGVMGPTHHAIEDYGILLTLPNMMAFTPVFDEDIPAVVARAGGSSLSAYLRLGRGEAPRATRHHRMRPGASS